MAVNVFTEQAKHLGAPLFNPVAGSLHRRAVLHLKRIGQGVLRHLGFVVIGGRELGVGHDQEREAKRDGRVAECRHGGIQAKRRSGCKTGVGSGLCRLAKCGSVLA